MEQSLEPLTQSAILFAVMLGTIAIGIQVLRKYRDREAQDGEEASEMMTKFRELHAEGGLSDEEFRTIKTKLAEEMKTQLIAEPEIPKETTLKAALKAPLNDDGSTS